MEPRLVNSPGSIDIYVSGERFLSYRSDSAVPGIESILCGGERLVTRLAQSVGLAVWVGHGNVNGVAFAAPDAGIATGATTDGSIITHDLVARRGPQMAGIRHETRWVAPGGAIFLDEVRTLRAADRKSTRLNSSHSS